MEFLIEIFCGSIIIGLIIYKWAIKNNNFFNERNVSHKKPLFLVGNNLPVLEGRETSAELLIKLHNRFKNEKIYGYYNFRNPYFIIHDSKLIEKIFAKDYESFSNRFENRALLIDDVTKNMLSVSNDDKYMSKREMVDHMFLEQNMVEIFNIVNECSKSAIKSLERRIQSDGKEIDLEDYFRRYSTDVTASAAFGMEINSFKEKDNEFLTMISDLLRTRSLCAAIKSFYLTISPQVYKVYRLNRLYFKTLQLLRNFVGRIFGSRQKN